MFCKKCGNEINEKINYCPNCGEQNETVFDTYKYNIEEEKAMFCVECGNQQGTGLYCKNCGAKLGKAKWREQSTSGSMGNIMQGFSAEGLQKDIKETWSQYKDTDIKNTVKHGAVFATCMTMLTLLFVLIVQKVANMLPIFHTSFWVKNSGARDVKSYILAAMYGLKVNQEGTIGISLDNMIKVPSAVIFVTLLFVLVSFFITKKVSGRSKKCNLLELAIFSVVNSVFVIASALSIKEHVVLKKSEEAQSYGGYDFSLITGISLGSCLCMVFLVTLCLLVLVNGTKLKKEEKNSALLYAFRSNIAFIGAVLLLSVLTTIVLYVKLGTEQTVAATSVVVLGALFQMLYSMVTNFGTGFAMSIDGTSVLGVSMNFTNIKMEGLGITMGELSTKWPCIFFFVLFVFLAVRVVYDVLKILKHVNTNDLSASLIEIGKYAAGYSAITALVIYMQNMYLKFTFDVSNDYISNYSIALLDGRSVTMSFGVGSLVSAFFKVFIVVFLISAVTFFVSKNYAPIVETYVLEKKEIIKRVRMLLICLPALCVWFASAEKAQNSITEFGNQIIGDSRTEEQSERLEQQFNEKMQQKGLNDQTIEAVYEIPTVLKGMLAR